jgi:hypothetical protein
MVTDFEGILDHLRRAGFTMAAIERYTGIPRTTLIEYRTCGTTPLHENGERLVAFYCMATNTTRAQVPHRAARAQRLLNPHTGVDFAAMLEKLRRFGFSWPSIYRETGIPVGTLKNCYLTDASPMHHNAERLIKFYCQATGDQIDRLPMRPTTHTRGRISR